MAIKKNNAVKKINAYNINSMKQEFLHGIELRLLDDQIIFD